MLILAARNRLNVKIISRDITITITEPVLERTTSEFQSHSKAIVIREIKRRMIGKPLIIIKTKLIYKLELTIQWISCKKLSKL